MHIIFKKYFPLILVGICCLNLTSSDVSPFPFAKSSLLWKIEGPSIKKGSYLFGTMHLIEKRYFIFPSKLEKIVSKTDLLVMELAGIPNQSEAINLVTLKEGSFFDFFNTEQIDSILIWSKDELMMNEQTFRNTFSKMKPFVIVQMATQLQFMGKTESYELSFQKIAKLKNIKSIGLETIEFQMSIFDNLSVKEQAEMVMEGVRDSKKSIELIKKMQLLYQRQNIDSLFMIIQEEGGVISEKQTNFLDERNQNWIPLIKEHLSKSKCFIAVGAGHLGGNNGVIRLLQKEGYILTPVEF